MFKSKWLTALVLVAVLLFSSSCNKTEEPADNMLEDVLSEQYGDVFSDYINSGSDIAASPVETELVEDETVFPEEVNNGPEINNYHVVDIGKFYDGLARVTVYVYDEGYWSSEASAAT